MEIQVKTMNPDGSLRDPEEIRAEIVAEIQRLASLHCYTVKVDGKGIGANADMPGLTQERANVLYAELLDRANDQNAIFPSPLKFQEFGVYKRNLSTGELELVPGLFHAARTLSRRESHFVRRPRWVR